MLGRGKGHALGPPVRNVFRFGGGRHASVGTEEVRMPNTQDFFPELTVDDIELNVPLLLVQGRMDHHRICFNNTTNTLACVNDGVGLPVVRKPGHAYYEWGFDMLYTYPELRKTHKHVCHARPERLSNVMKRADASNVVPDTLKQPQDVASGCDVCRHLAYVRSLFPVALLEETSAGTGCSTWTLGSWDSKSCCMLWTATRSSVPLQLLTDSLRQRHGTVLCTHESRPVSVTEMSSMLTLALSCDPQSSLPF